MTSFGSDIRHTHDSTARWAPQLAFFRKGQSFVTISGRTMTVYWHFERIHLGHLGFAYVICHLHTAEMNTEGQGYALSAGAAMRQAFAEAWERLFVLLGAEGLVDGIKRVTSSNGFAAGATDEDAKVAARGELIERAILLTAWRSRRGWHPVNITSFAASFLKTILRGQGWTLNLFRLDGSGLGSVLAGLARHEEKGAVFDTVYLPRETHSAGAESKLLRSLLRSTLFASGSCNIQPSLPVVGKPEDHAYFYRQTANNVAFAFLNSLESSAEPINLANPDDVQTTLLNPAGPMPAVAVASHPSWPTLSWGLQSLASYGCGTEKGVNPWPHPLA